jgi:RNA polymerase sigma-70 factor (ECF subfamily)
LIDLDEHLAAIRLGDAGAFARWLAGAERSVRESLRPFAVSVDTEAVLQESLLRAWQFAPRVEPDGKPNALLRYAVRIARNVAISEIRRTRAKAVDPETLDVADPSPSAPPDPMLRRAIEDCRGALPMKPAQALAARLESGGADADEALAARLGMKPNTFLQNFTRARKMLGDCLESKGVAP